jgi:hypothetical protein
MILQLNVSLDLGNISLSIRLSFLLILINLFFKVVFYAFLQSLKVTLTLLFDALELSH